MRKWCPEPFDRKLDDPRSAGDGPKPYHPEIPAGRAVPEGGDTGFQKDLYLSDRHSLWDLLNRAEKDQLLEKAREILAVEYEEQKAELGRRHLEETAAIRAEFDRQLDSWSREWSEAWYRENKQLAVEAAGLSLALARKIIRDTVQVDPEFLSRTIETALFKIQDTRALTAVLNPQDAELLNANPDLRKRLRVDTVISDRRVEKGGCRLRCGPREWDATLAGQMDALAAVVENVLAAAGSPGPTGSGGQDDSLLD